MLSQDSPDDESAPQALYREVHASGQWSGRTLVLSVMLHVLVVVTPLPGLLAARPAPRLPVTVRVEYDWQTTSASRVLPPIYPTRRPKQKPSAVGQERRPLPPRGAEVVQPQTIVSNPPHPNHPRQTLLHQFTLEEARVSPQDLRLPNMVIPPAVELVPPTRLNLRRLRIPPAAKAPLPKSPARLALEKARLENSFPRLTVPTSRGAGAPASAPELGGPVVIARSGDLTASGLVALSLSPSAPVPVLELPTKNLRARFVAGPAPGSGSPGGIPGRAPRTDGGSGGGPGGVGGGENGLVVPDILVTPAGPVPPRPVVVGPGSEGGSLPGSASAPGPPTSPPSQIRSTPETQSERKKTPQERARAMLEAIESGEGSGKRSPRVVRFTYVYLANLASQSSTWVLRYAEPETDNPGHATGNPGERKQRKGVSAPRAVRKVDPCYPSNAHWERVEGKVMLYGVIDADGRVQDVTVVQGLDARADKRATEAFTSSRFEPARKDGRPIAVEVIVEIPFRLALCF